jgi:hypothetical protein
MLIALQFYTKSGYARGVSGERALPEQPSLRYLKVEAKRRRAAGEFPTLHHAQRAIAREYGQPSWTALREAAEAAAGQEGHALAQLRWIAARFRGAGEPGWVAPGEEELREHFTEKFLSAFPPARLIAMIKEVAPALRAELTVIIDRPFIAQGRLAGHLVMGETEPRAPYRLSGIRARRLGERISDQRAAAPGTAAAAAPWKRARSADSSPASPDARQQASPLGALRASCCHQDKRTVLHRCCGQRCAQRRRGLWPGLGITVDYLCTIRTVTALTCANRRT